MSFEGSEMQLHSKSIHSWCHGSLDRSLMVDVLCSCMHPVSGEVIPVSVSVSQKA